MNLQNLSDEELLSNFVPIKSAENLLKEYNSIYDVVLNTTKAELKSINGMTENRLKKILSIREILKRMQDYRTKELSLIRKTNDAINYFEFLQDKQVEELWIAVLNTKNNVVLSRCISRGTVNMSVVNPREIFNVVIKNMASAIIIAHNHPSGDSMPSNEDISLTKKVMNLSEMLGIVNINLDTEDTHSSLNFSLNLSQAKVFNEFLANVIASANIQNINESNLFGDLKIDVEE